MNNPQASPDLASLRVQIDNIDQQLLTLLNQRALVAERVGEIKKRAGNREDPDRQPRAAQGRPRGRHLARNHVRLPGA